MFVSVQPGSGVSWTYLVPNWGAVKSNGAVAVGLATAVSRVKVAGRPAPVPLKSNVAVPPTLCFSMSSEAPQRASAISRSASASSSGVPMM